MYYVFARYPDSDEPQYPLHDLVICHGDFLNPMRDYVHENKSIRTFGAYGDIMIRDRKMYVVKTPYALATGLAGQRTLILPTAEPQPPNLVAVGHLARVEAERVAVGYEFNLRTNTLVALDEPNPNAGRVHAFIAYRLPAEADPPVVLV